MKWNKRNWKLEIESEREQKKLEIEREQKKLESEERREVRRLEFKSKELETQKSEDGKVRESKDMERPKFESSSYQDKINVNTTTMRIDVPKMYDENFNLDNYFTVFERLAVAQGWEKNKWVSRLTSQFNARCQDIFSRISVELCQDYETVKQSLLDGYNLGPESYRKAFKALERKSPENFKDFAVELSELFSKWLKGMQCTTFEQLSQLLLLEKFYTSVPKELVALLKDKKITTLNEAGKLADQLDSFRDKVFSNQGHFAARDNDNSKKFHPNFNNHRESKFDSLRDSRRTQDSRNDQFNKFPRYNNSYRDNRSNSHSSFYNKKPHVNDKYQPYKNKWSQNHERSQSASWNYPNKTVNTFRNRVNFVNTENSSQGKSLSKSISCRFCKKFGHQIEQCHLMKLYCSKCQKNGHNTQYCRASNHNFQKPFNAFITKKNNIANEIFGDDVMQLATVNKIKTRCLRDTGSSISLIRKDLIPNLTLLPEFTVCTTAFNSKHTIPMALIDIVTKEGSGTLKVGVVDELLVDLILGNDVKNLSVNTEEFCAAITRSRAKQIELSNTDGETEIQTESNQKLHLARAKPIFNSNLDTVIEEEATQKLINEIPEDLFKFESLKNTTRQEFIDEQQTDLSLARVRKAIGMINNKTHKDKPNATHYFVRNGIIFRKYYFSKIGKVGEESSIKQLVVPLKYRRSILSIGHDDPLASHLGVAKTKSIILKRFFWPGIFKDIFQYVTSCEKCQLVGKKVKRAKAPMIIMPTASHAWERIIFDIVGPLERSKKGNQYILVVIDVHSHYPEAFPLKTIDSKNVANELMKLFTRVGIPTIIQHDQATNFLSKMMLQLYALLGINHISSSCYHPETNALVERLNGTIKKLLRTCLVGRDTRTWDEILPLVLFSIRASKHETTGFSPFELMFGYQIRGPLDILRELWVEETTEGNPVDLHQYVLDLRTTMRALATQAIEKEETTKRAVKDRYDKTAQLVEYGEGDQVFLLMPHKVSSLTASWMGPYVVQKKLGPVTYRILVHNRSKKIRVCHANMLRKYIPRISCFVSTTPEGEEFENETPASFPEAATRTATSENIKINEKLSIEQKFQVRKLVKEFDNIFSDLPGSTYVLRHQIRTINDEPINCVPYKVPQALIPIVEKEIAVALQLGLIEPVINERNPTAYASPTLLVKKKEQGKYRLCIDHRKLNSVSIPQRYNIPNASHLIDKVSGAKWLSLVDLTKGYNQVPICKEDIHKTGFICLGKHYVCRYLSFGLLGGPSTFQLLVDTVLAGMSDFSVAFIDDICIFSNSFDDHMSHLRRVFEALKQANLTAQPTKAVIAMSELRFLGHIVGGGKRSVDAEKISILEKIKIPRTKRDIRSFLGFVGFYKTFIPSFSEIADPLTDLLKKSTNDLIPWTPLAERAFTELKKGTTTRTGVSVT